MDLQHTEQYNTQAQQPQEKAILVGISNPPEVYKWQAEDYLSELEQLADTAGAKVLGKIIQDKRQVNPVFSIGSGKVREIADFVHEQKIDLVIFDGDLSPLQIKNLGKAFECKVLDRTALILQIFAVRAKSSQAKLQVELAQLEYLLPRLTRQWTHLSKQKGGIGTKGPGETQIETDRRLIWQRISTLKQRLKQVSTQHQTQTRLRDNVVKFSLVGYTNAGKSTLMNVLCPKAQVESEDRVFATLDTTTRRLDLDCTEDVVLSDTVGFIRKLPHKLVESFKSTLDEVRDSDFLIHLVDLSHPHYEEQMEVVENTLKDIGVENKDTLLVMNKIDRLSEDQDLTALKKHYPNAVFISAARSININALKSKLAEQVKSDFENHYIRIHVSDYRIISLLHEKTDVLKKHYDGEDIDVWFSVSKKRMPIIESALSKANYVLNHEK